MFTYICHMFKSVDCEGQSKSFILHFEVCFGSFLFCFSFVTGCVSFAFRLESFLSSTCAKFPVPVPTTQPQSILESPLCITAGNVFFFSFLSNAASFFLQTNIFSDCSQRVPFLLHQSTTGFSKMPLGLSQYGFAHIIRSVLW